MPKWKHVWLGSIVTGILFTIGKTLFSSISALQILRLFMELQAPSFSPVVGFYSSMILFRAEFICRVYAEIYNEKRTRY
jgi:membrane protein